ncbi:hypothetical protein KBY28_20930, partial [Ruegeria pomeroyi]|uniref:hypothetical protein n=1 Tax=Ruegeria pomeroyi TaxID=89184 RepID=UPI001F1D6BC6
QDLPFRRRTRRNRHFLAMTINESGAYSDPTATPNDLGKDQEGDSHALGDDALENLNIKNTETQTEEQIEEANRRNIRPGQPLSPSARFEAMRDQVLRGKIDAARARLGLGPATYAAPQNFQPNSKTNAALQNQLNALQNQIRSQSGTLTTTTPTFTGRNQAPKTAVPNSVHEQYNNGVLDSRTFYDNNGRPFSRQDFGHPHGGMQPHEHNFNFNGYGQPISPTTVTPLNGTGWQ